MKKIVPCFITILIMGCSNSNQKIIATDLDTSIYYPYPAVYSRLEKGNPVYAKTVLEVWRAYETGNILSAAKKFSDSLTLIFEDNIFTGRSDSVLKLFQNRRNNYSTVQSYVDSWLPVYANDVNKDLVFVWGRMDCTTENGKRDYLVIHEIWRFDGFGKIREMDQYITHPH